MGGAERLRQTGYTAWMNQVGGKPLPKITPNYFRQQLPKTITIAAALTRDIAPEQARVLRDGADGWSVVEVVAHLRDYETIFRERAQQMKQEQNPNLPAYDHERLAIERRYNDEVLSAVLAAWATERERTIAFFTTLGEGDWSRPGRHPERQEFSLLAAIAQIVSHDLTHLEQLAKIRAAAALGH